MSTIYHKGGISLAQPSPLYPYGMKSFWRQKKQWLLSRKMDMKSRNESFSRDWEDVEIEAREVDLNDMQFAAILIIWLIIEVFGNGMLIGLIVYEKEGNGDPLKRRIQCGSKVRPVALFYTVKDPF